MLVLGPFRAFPHERRLKTYFYLHLNLIIRTTSKGSISTWPDSTENEPQFLKIFVKFERINCDMINLS